MASRVAGKIKLQSVDELLGVPEIAGTQEIEIERIHAFPNHPFKVLDDEKMDTLVDSIRENGILNPVIVRPDQSGNYEMISGHRRLHAAKIVGLKKVPAIVKEMSDDEAIIKMVDANIQREEILPSERAFSFKMKMEAMSRQGSRVDLTCGTEFHKSGDINKKTRETIGDEAGMTGRQVTKYIRLVFIGSEKKVNVDIEYYSEIKDIFSRNKGIVAMDTIRKKQAVIAGMGSGGFKIGIELVRAGIGSLIVADDDIVSYHNVCRHECGIHDVGRYKVDCFKEKAADINPNCVVYTYRELIQHVDPELLKENIWKDSVIISCADNRHCGYICNKISDTYNIPMIDAGCGPRASTGEVFYYKPDSGMACYTCTYGEDKGIDYSNQAVRRQFYATEKELEKVNFQPGMYLDIELVAIFTAKLAIDLLMETDEGYEMKILPYISQCTILLNYPIDKDVNPYMQIFGEEPSIKPLIWKSVSAKKNPKCDYCGNT